MGSFQDEDADSPNLFRGEEESQGSQEGQRKQIQGGHEICEATRSTALQHVDGVLEKIFLSGMSHDLWTNQKLAEKGGRRLKEKIGRVYATLSPNTNWLRLNAYLSQGVGDQRDQRCDE